MSNAIVRAPVMKSIATGGEQQAEHYMRIAERWGLAADCYHDITSGPDHGEWIVTTEEWAAFVFSALTPVCVEEFEETVGRERIEVAARLGGYHGALALWQHRHTS